MLTSRAARLKYNFPQTFFRPDGHVIFTDISAARGFANQMSAQRTEPVSATDLYIISLLDEAYHILLRNYYSRYTGAMARAMGSLQSNLGSKYDLTLSLIHIFSLYVITRLPIHPDASLARGDRLW